MIEGLELIAAAESVAGVEDATKGEQEGTNNAGGEDTQEKKKGQGLMIQRISRGALKMLKKHIDALSSFIEE